MRYAQKQRLLFIQEELTAKGFVERKDLMDKFEIATAQVSRDFGAFKAFNPGAMEYNLSNKRYEAKVT